MSEDTSFLESFVQQYISGEQGCEMEYDTAQAMARKIKALLDRSADRDAERELRIQYENENEQWQARHSAAVRRAEAAEARERALLETNQTQRDATVEAAHLRHKLRKTEGLMRIMASVHDATVRGLLKDTEAAEAERDALKDDLDAMRRTVAPIAKIRAERDAAEAERDKLRQGLKGQRKLHRRLQMLEGYWQRKVAAARNWQNIWRDMACRDTPDLGNKVDAIVETAREELELAAKWDGRLRSEVEIRYARSCIQEQRQEVVGALRASVEYMEACATETSQPYPLTRARAVLEKLK